MMSRMLQQPKVFTIEQKPKQNKQKTKKNTKPAEGIEPSIYRLRSGCLATWPYRLYLNQAAARSTNKKIGEEKKTAWQRKKRKRKKKKQKNDIQGED